MRRNAPPAARPQGVLEQGVDHHRTRARGSSRNRGSRCRVSPISVGSRGGRLRSAGTPAPIVHCRCVWLRRARASVATASAPVMSASRTCPAAMCAAVSLTSHCGVLPPTWWHPLGGMGPEAFREQLGDCVVRAENVDHRHAVELREHVRRRPASSAALRAVSAIIATGLEGGARSTSRCVSCPAPIKMGVRSSIVIEPMSLRNAPGF